MGLAHQVGNQVTLSYRQQAFSRLKERNAQRIAECMRKHKLKVVFNSKVAEFKRDSVALDLGGRIEEIPNDFAWIFAGGEPPTAFLQKIGVAVGHRDVTREASKEAKQAKSVLVPVS